MNGAIELQGLDSLFREHKRLATKLTAAEVRALRDFIEQRLLQEQAEIYFQFFALQNDYDLTLRTSNEAIADLHNELGEKREILKQYRASDETISKVHKQREARWQQKQDLMLSEIDKGEQDFNEIRAELQRAQKELDEKTAEMKKLEEKLDAAEEAMQMADEARQVVKEKEKMRQDMLRLKLEIDKRDRALAAVNRELNAVKNEKKRMVEEKSYLDVKVEGMQKELRKQMRDVAHKCTRITELEFCVQDEKRQVAECQREMKKMRDEKASYTRMLADSERALFSNRERTELIIKKDLEVIDSRIKVLELSCRVRDEEARSVIERMEQNRTVDKLVSQIRNEVFMHGNTFLELTVVELQKKLESDKNKLSVDLRRVRDISDIKKDASLLKSDVSALKKQAEVNMLIDLSNRASKQIHRIDACMRAFKEKSKHHVPILSDRREKKKVRDNAEPQSPTFLTTNTPDIGVDSPTPTPRRRIANGPSKSRSIPLAEKHSINTVDLQSLTPSHIDIAINPATRTPRGRLSPLKQPVAKAAITSIAE